MDEKQLEELLKYLGEISKSLKSISNSLFWILHRGEIEP